MNLAWTCGDFVSPKLHRPDFATYPIIGRLVNSRVAMQSFSAVHIMLPSPKRQARTSGRFKNIWRFRRFPCRLLRLPKRIGLKSCLRLSALVVRSFSITSSDASTHFRPA
jgi:hypothetical protein